MPHILDEYAADIEADIYSAKPVSSTKLKNLTLIENAIMNAYVNVKTALDDSRMRN
jgi:F0F1-type ATP synthase delta subunit